MNLFATRLRPGERAADALLRVAPCTSSSHDALAVECLPFVGVQRDLCAELDPGAPPIPLLLADCVRCGSTLSRSIPEMLHDDQEPGR